MTKKYIMAIDQGTTGTRAILFDHAGKQCATSYQEIEQIFPQPGWVEHNPHEHWESVKACCQAVLREVNASAEEVAAIGITNQRETCILWDADTGEPLYNALVWQDRRGSAMCDQLKADGHERIVKEKTGLVIDSYFSGSKIKWLIENAPGAKEKIASGKARVGTVDSWLIWNFSGGDAHVTDFSNASRTLLLNIHELKWDDDLLEIFGIPAEILPQLMPSSGVMATTEKDGFFGAEIPIAGVAGDQHAATFGQACFSPGMVKNSYGTGMSVFMNIGTEPVYSKHGLTTNLGWQINGKTEYALEGVMLLGGAAVQWVREGLKMVDDSTLLTSLAQKVPDTSGVYFVPAFNGLSAPYWDQYARGLIIGITRGTTQEHIARATLESVAYRVRDIVDAMEADLGIGKKSQSLRVDGGMTKSKFLMQFQADLLGVPIELPEITEMTSLGAAYLAGLGVGFWESQEELAQHWKLACTYEPKMSVDQRESIYAGWKEAVKRSLNWAK